MTATATKIERLQADADKAAHELKTLKAEHAGFAGAIEDAGRAGDAGKLVKLRRRQDELPVLIQGAQVRHLRAQIALGEALEADEVADLKPLLDAQIAAKERLDAAQAEYNSAFNEYTHARSFVRSGKSDLAARRRELSDLIGSMGRDSGPVMRARNLVRRH